MAGFPGLGGSQEGLAFAICSELGSVGGEAVRRLVSWVGILSHLHSCDPLSARSDSLRLLQQVPDRMHACDHFLEGGLLRPVVDQVADGVVAVPKRLVHRMARLPRR